MLELDYALAGLALGAIAALSGVGLLITYRATGVFNIAHGAVAMMAARRSLPAAFCWRPGRSSGRFRSPAGPCRA